MAGALTLLAVAAFGSPAHGQSKVPGTLIIEGVLLGAGGGPAADGDYTATFALYDKSTGGKTLYTDKDVKLVVKGGRFAVTIGKAKALTSTVLGGLSGAWIGIKIGADPELPRAPLHSVPYALRAQSAHNLDCVGCVSAKHIAGGSLGPQQVNFAYAAAADGIKGGDAKAARALKCTGCVTVKMIKFDADISMAGNALSAGKVTVKGDVIAGGTIAAKQFIGDGSKLTGIQTPAGTCSKVGEVVKGINADGSLKCVAALDPKALPPDGIDEISNGLVANQFIDHKTGATIKLADNDPNGILATIDFPDIGIAQDIKVTIDITNSNTADLVVWLFPPNCPVLPPIRSKIITNHPAKPSIDAKKYPHYVLHMKTQFDKNNKTVIKTSFPKPTKALSGSIHGDWLNKNIKGKWRLLIVDTAHLTNTTDGQLNSWQIDIQTLSNKKIQIKGDLYVNSNLYVKKSAWVDQNLTVKGKLYAPGGIDSSTTPSLQSGRRMYTTVFAARSASDCPKGWTVLQSDQYSGDNKYVYGNITGSGLTIGGMNSVGYGQAYLYFGSHHNNVQWYCYKEHVAPTGHAHTSFFIYKDGKGKAGCPKGYTYLYKQTIHGHTGFNSTGYFFSNENGWYLGHVDTYSWSYNHSSGTGAHRRNWTSHVDHFCFKVMGVEDDPETSAGVYPVFIGLHKNINECPAGWNRANTTDYDGSNGYMYNYVDDNVSVLGGTGSWWYTNGANYLARNYHYNHVKYLCWKYLPMLGRGGATIVTNDRTNACPSSDYTWFSASNVKGSNNTGYIQQTGYGLWIGGRNSWWTRDAHNGHTAFYFSSYTDKRVCLRLHNVKK